MGPPVGGDVLTKASMRGDAANNQGNSRGGESFLVTSAFCGPVYDGPVQESRADHNLADEVRAKGYAVTDRQVRRWRQEDVLPPTVVRRLGRGRGTESSYPDEALDVALGLAQALDEDRNLHRAVLVAFIRGAEVGDEALRRAYRTTCSDFAEKMRSAILKGRLPEVRFRRLKRGPGRPRAQEAGKQKAMVHAVFDVALGRKHDPGQVRAFLDVMGLGRADLDAMDLDDLTEAEISSAVEMANLTVVSSLVQGATRAELEAARDRLNSLRGPSDGVWADIEAAMCAPLLIQLARAGLLDST
jgi:hypothetical protein